LHIEGLQDLDSSPIIISVITLMRMRWVVHVMHMAEEVKCVQDFSVQIFRKDDS